MIFALVALYAVSQDDAASRDWLNRGVQLFKSANYPEAVAAFQRAVDLNPAGVNAHLYLGTAFMTQWIPGADAPEQAELAHKAQTEFESVLRLDPDNLIALQSLASLAYNQAAPLRDPAEKGRMLNQAADWNRKLIAVNPRDKQAYYSLGVISWLKFYPELSATRARLGMAPESPGPLTDLNAREDLRGRFGSVIEDGIRNLQKALEIDHAYDDAMAYMNLLIRERADLHESASEYKRDIEIADEWVRRTLETKRAKVEGSGARPMPGAADPRANTIPPPPASDGERRIRVGSAPQGSNLLFKVDPAYPPLARQARIQGTVRLRAVIGKDGRVRDVQLLRGHPLLAPAALDAVKDWAYRPTLLNGQPVEVLTEIDVPFTLTQ